MSEKELTSLFLKLASQPREREWLEFKLNFHSPEEIGENISALANSACLHNQAYGYLLFGIEDGSQRISGTTFKPSREKRGNEDIEHWIVQRLSPKIDYRIHELVIDHKPVVMFEIPAATGQPVEFLHEAYIRVGSITRKLRDFPEKAKKIWLKKPENPFEKEICMTGLSAENVVKLLDTQAFFDMLELPYPTHRDGVIERFVSERLIVPANEGYHITHLGALCFAKDITAFEKVSRKAPRVIVYKGNNKLETVKEQEGKRGYAVGFQGLVDFINNQLPVNEAIESAIRKNVKVYPELAIRELVANALIHQDFNIGGTGPMIEIFSDRIEVTNPGLPLITTNRFIDEYQSRNEILASLMRRLGICEEKGSGVDKVVGWSEVYQLPAPDFMTLEKHTKAVMFAPKELSRMNKKERVRSCYQHCCLKYVSNEQMTNQTLRERFGIDERNAAMASRIIKETLEAKMIKYEDPDSTSRKYASYIPFWA